MRKVRVQLQRYKSYLIFWMFPSEYQTHVECQRLPYMKKSLSTTTKLQKLFNSEGFPSEPPINLDFQRLAYMKESVSTTTQV